MKNRFSKRRLVVAGMLVVTLLAAKGCTPHDRTEDCPPPKAINVTAFSKVAGDLYIDQSARIRDVVIFVYDEKEKLLGRIDTQPNTTVPFEFSGHNKYYIVALGNSAGGYFTVAARDGLASSGISLNSNAKTAPPKAPVDDLFFGEQCVELKPGYTIEQVDLHMLRQVGAMNVTVRGLPREVGDVASDYQVVVQETYQAMDFLGRMTNSAGRATYYPTSTFLSNGDLFVDNFNLLPSESGYNVAIDILYHNTPLTRGIVRETYTPGSTINIKPNSQNNILIDYGDPKLRKFNSMPVVQIIFSDWGAPVPGWIGKEE